MSIFATAGARLYIGPVMAQQAADFVIGDFAGFSWTEVAWTENLGTVGDESTEITFEAINRSRTVKLKGTRNAGTMAVVCGVDAGDPGQIALLAAEATPDDYAFRLVFDDAPPAGTPSERYFIAKVMSASEQLDTANNVVRVNASLGVNSNVVRVNAAP